MDYECSVSGSDEDPEHDDSEDEITLQRSGAVQDPNPTAGDADDNNCTQERSHMADGASLRLERWAALNCHHLHRCDHHCDPLVVIIIIVCLFV